MKEARLIVPVLAIGEDTETLERQIAEEFGGFTRSFGWGGWIDHLGELIRENVYIYEIAATSTGTNALMELATTLRNTLGEDAIYIRLPDGKVELV